VTEPVTPPPVRVLVDGRWLWQHVCQAPGCGVVFTSRYPNARTHSTSCRMARYRARLAAQKSPD
jgi:hypothetical protein